MKNLIYVCVFLAHFLLVQSTAIQVVASTMMITASRIPAAEPASAARGRCTEPVLSSDNVSFLESVAIGDSVGFVGASVVLIHSESPSSGTSTEQY